MYKKVQDLQPIYDYVKIDNEIHMVVNIVLTQYVVEMALYSKRKRSHITYRLPYDKTIKCVNNPHN